MKTLVVLAHPSQKSFNHAVFTEVLAGLREAGHEVRTLDLYGEGFEARLSEPEWRTNSDVPENRKPVETLVEDLEWAEALVLVFPTWWSGVPAILKGWIDRVFLPGVAFELTEKGPVWGKLKKLRLWVTVTTSGASPLQTLALFDPVRLYMRAMRIAVARQAKPVLLRLYKMDSVSAEERAAFLAKVRERMRTLA